MKYIPLIIFSILILAGCGPVETDVVRTSWPDGSPKLIRSYIIEGSDSLAVKDVSYYESGAKRMAGPLKEGRRHGAWKYWYRNGMLWSESEFIAGEQTGPAINYYPNGKRESKGEYIDGIRVGIWEFWDEKGFFEKEIDYSK